MISATCADLQAKLDASQNGDVITLSETCSGQSFNLKSGVSITLQGDDGEVRAGFDGSTAPTRILTGHEVGSTTLRNLSFGLGSSASSEPGAGAFIDLKPNALLTLDNVSFISNSAGGDGGGLAVIDGSLNVVNSVFDGNCSSGSGGGLHANVVDVSIESSHFERNCSNGGSGGGAFLSAGRVTLNSNVFLLNSADVHGGGLAVLLRPQAASLTSTVSENTIAKNSSSASQSGSGGGLAIIANHRGPSVLQEGNAVHQNGSGTGGGEFVTNVEVISRNDIFRFNGVSGAPSSQASGGGLALGPGAEFRGENLVVIKNGATGSNATGGGIYLGGSAEAPAALALSNSTVSANRIEGVGAIGSEIGSRTGSDVLSLRNSIATTTRGPGVAGFANPEILYTDACASSGFGFSGPGNMCLSPLLEQDGYRETSSSPTIDSGSNELVPASLSEDFDGGPRIVGTVDMGADEFDIETNEGPSGDPTCFDLMDNDGDALIDGDDPDCIHVDFVISGVKFDDTNGNGTRDDGEVGLAGWEIHVTSVDFDQHVTTGEDGSYFLFVVPGEYTVCESLQPGWSQTTPAGGADCSSHNQGEAGEIVPGPFGYQVSVGFDGDDTGALDFGNRQATCAQRGLVSDPTLANSLLGTENEDGSISEPLHGLDTSIPAPLVDSAVHEAACGVAAVEDLFFSPGP